MPAIALYTEEKSLLCFLLVAGDDSIAEGKNERDCILTCPAAKAPDLEHPLSIARTEYLHVEHKALKKEKGDGLELTVPIADLGTLTIDLGDEKGTWIYSGEFGSHSGISMLAKPKKD
jgi:hypothetical protein